jgi:hypothetical protein
MPLMQPPRINFTRNFADKQNNSGAQMAPPADTMAACLDEKAAPGAAIVRHPLHVIRAGCFKMNASRARARESKSSPSAQT